MKLTVKREILTGKSTGGRLYVDNVFECYTLEDVDRKVEGGGKKIKSETCIPRGRYKVVVDFSNRFQKMMPHLLNVPQFDGVRIHSGNTAADTEGCILVGNVRGENCVLDSRVAYNRLFAKIEAASKAGEEITVDVE